jgi:tRNA nucleotidyltransferase (CCA-adding enzyme)
VGGSVRDMIMNIEPKDYDLELFRVWPSDFVKYLNDKKIPFKFNSDAKFPVYRVCMTDNIMDDEEWVEIGFPRVDNRIGPKHSDFECLVDPFMSVIDAAMRRDFTINAVYYNLLKDDYENHGFGMHITQSYLSPVHQMKFKEDPLRIMSGFQFVSRFSSYYRDVAESVDVDMINGLSHVDPSGIYAEFVKGITKAKDITKALEYLCSIALMNNGTEFFKPITDMHFCLQNSRHHFEGSVWEHTKLVIKNAIELADTDDEKVLMFFAAFFHDIGKIPTFKLDTAGNPIAHGHDVEGDDLVELYGSRFGLPKKMIKQVIVLKHCHMIGNDAKNKKLYLMAEELEKVGLNFDILCKLMLADVYGSIKEYFRSTIRSHGEIYNFISRIKLLGIELKPLRMFINGDDILYHSNGKIKGQKLGDLLYEMKMLQINNRVVTRQESFDFMKKRIENILEKIVDKENSE